MKAGDEASSGSGNANGPEDVGLGFLPKDLTERCRRLIESYHGVRGYARLPDLLWQSYYGSFIETHPELRRLLRRASRTRSTKKSNEGFARIATKILALEILASCFAGWSAHFPEAARRAGAILKKNELGRHMPLTEFYLRPPKYPGSAALATLAAPAHRPVTGVDPYVASRREFSDQRRALDAADAINQTSDDKLPRFVPEPLV
jgi:hypothetical protein